MDQTPDITALSGCGPARLVALMIVIDGRPPVAPPGQAVP